ncbi:hypothetical protein K431DRAFT_266640 [Polychaeton citri CBS 116435]|uniref:Inheritance of peroxisomes protein 1 n=1 Tax=Polychaeton citri CBS 116435 TaxID=1314669 RepID=A0A9P4Q809_9PEZI|nr:hypothetical protein K431DRAFT_266640 [Polychaeton citri CBS 116435]
MASFTAPSTPEQSHLTPKRMAATRSFTVPSKLEASSNSPRPNVDIGASESVETLFFHPKANIVKFTASSNGSRPSSSRQSPSPGNAQAMLLPWASSSSTERTLAIGPLEIYRIPGSVSFLHSGSLLHAILPRSQCWCVDGVSKFAMRVLTDTYYRIELPGETEEELALVELFKDCLRKVLWFERTPCPFERTFTVELPNEPDLVVRRGQRRNDGPAKKWKLDRAYSWKPENGVWPEQRMTSAQSSNQGSQAGSDEELEEKSGDDLHRHVSEDEKEELADQIKDLGLNTPTKPKAISAATRSVTAPPQLLTLRSTPPSKSRVKDRVQEFADGTVEAKGVAQASGVSRLDENRLRTFQTIPTDMPPSPPDSSAGVDPMDVVSMQNRRDAELDRGDSSVIIHPIEADESMPNILEETSPSEIGSPQQAPREKRQAALEAAETIQDNKMEQVTVQTRSASKLRPAVEIEEHAAEANKDDPFAAIQARIRARRNVGTLNSKRSSSSLTRQTSSTSSSSSTTTRLALKPSKSGLTHELSHSNLPRNQSLAAAMVQKACAVFLGPPVHLVAIMLSIAARLTNNAFGAIFVESPERLGRRIPGSYFLEDELESETDGSNAILEDWEEDDFGVPLRSPVRLAAMENMVGTAQGDEVEGESGRTSWSVD